jgi:hypothetical protein
LPVPRSCGGGALSGPGGARLEDVEKVVSNPRPDTSGEGAPLTTRAGPSSRPAEERSIRLVPTASAAVSIMKVKGRSSWGGKGGRMDDLLVQAVGGAIGNLASGIAVNAARAISSTQTSEAEQGPTCTLRAPNGDEVFLTDTDCASLTAFLDEPDVFALAAAIAMTMPLSTGSTDASKSLELAFRDKATAWCAGTRAQWHYSADIIWSCLANFCTKTLPGIYDLQRLSVHDYELLASDPRLAYLHSESGLLSPALRQIVEISRDKSRLVRARQLIGDIRHSSRDAYSEMWLQHLTEDQRFRYDDLYIDRTLNVSATGAELGSQNVFSAQVDAAQRAVVIGDPGVGKSTLVRRFVYVTAAADSSDRAPLLVRVREFGDLRRMKLLTEIVTSVTAKLSIDISEDALSDALTIGKIAMVFDGIDEITDISDRRELIRQIEAFARRFPLTQILSTSRRVGYPRAKFDESQFLVLDLAPYDETQVAEYVRRWFELEDRDAGDVVSFMYESRTIGNVRNNPLMLSLLCTLYRAVGYIPQNRMDTYQECADLLFKRWDAMRHIEQPFDHRRYGERLMQELAHFFYTTPSSTGGLDEGQLSRLIASFFQDTAGVDRGESLRRAKSFLDFCADRAWLLSSVGSGRSNARRFAFTHQTFLEFFAAQATIRKSNSRQDAVNAILSAFRNDGNYLMAELMVQEAEAKYENAAEELLSTLIPPYRGGAAIDSSTLALGVRIGNATPLKQHTWTRILTSLFASWRTASTPDNSYAETLALLELSGDAAARLQTFLLDNEDWNVDFPSPMRMLAVRYARLDLLGESTVFDREWGGMAESSLLIGLDTITDPTVANYLVLMQMLSPSVAFRQISPGYAAGLRVFGRPALGAALHVVDKMARNDEQVNSPRAVEFLALSLRSEFQIPHSLSLTILEAVGARMDRWPAAKAFNWDRVRPKHVRDILLWLRCLLAESVLSETHPLGVRRDLLVSQPDFLRLDRIRSAIRSGEIAIPAARSIRDQFQIDADLPDWYVNWTMGRYRIIPDIAVIVDTNVLSNMNRMNWWTGR